MWLYAILPRIWTKTPLIFQTVPSYQWLTKPKKEGESIYANHPDTNTKSAELRLVSIQKLITVIHVVSWTAGCGYTFPLIEHGLSMIAKPYFQ